MYLVTADLKLNHSSVFLFALLQFFVLCHSLLQLSQLLVSGYMKSSISTIERRYGLNSRKSGLLAAFNEVSSCCDSFCLPAASVFPLSSAMMLSSVFFCVCVCVYLCMCVLAMCSKSLYANVWIWSNSLPRQCASPVPIRRRTLSFQTLVCLCRWATRFSSFLWAFSGAESTGRGSSGVVPCWPAWLRCWWPYHTSSVDRMSTQIALAVRLNTNKDSQPQHSPSHHVANIEWMGLLFNLYYNSVTTKLHFMIFLSWQQPPVTTALACAMWRTPWAALPLSRAAAWRRIPPSRWSTRCCCWASCCWESQLSPYSHSVSPTLTTTPARGTHHFTLVRSGPSENECNSYLIKYRADT